MITHLSKKIMHWSQQWIIRTIFNETKGWENSNKTKCESERKETDRREWVTFEFESVRNQNCWIRQRGMPTFGTISCYIIHFVENVFIYLFILSFVYENVIFFLKNENVIIYLAVYLFDEARGITLWLLATHFCQLFFSSIFLMIYWFHRW